MKERVVLLLILSVIFKSCQYLPFWPFDHEEKPSDDVVHLASNFCGVLVPDRGKLYGCKWYPDSTYNNELTRCLGIWERDVETGEMREVWKDTSLNVTGYQVSRDFRYLMFVATTPTDQDVIFLLDLERMRVVDSVHPVFAPAGPLCEISPYTSEIFYFFSYENWGNTSVLWRLDFRTHEMTPLKRGGIRTGYHILPGKGDSVVSVEGWGGIQTANHRLRLLVMDGWLPDSFLLKDYVTGRMYRLVAVPPRETYWFANRDWWVHDRDSLLICTDWGGYYHPKRYDLWLIKNVTKHLQEVSP